MGVGLSYRNRLRGDRRGAADSRRAVGLPEAPRTWRGGDGDLGGGDRRLAAALEQGLRSGCGGGATGLARR